VRPAPDAAADNALLAAAATAVTAELVDQSSPCGERVTDRLGAVGGV
jgi:hypothetical protein